MTADELRREKARNLRYMKPVVREMNLGAIKNALWEIQEACAEVRWYVDSEDGAETLLNALDGEDDVWEFKMSFIELESDAERMGDDMESEYIPDCFDLMFAAIGAKDNGGGMLGYDDCEGDYFGLSGYEIELAEREAGEKLKRLTKAQLLDAMSVCFRVAMTFVGLRARYDNLKAALDILRCQNTALLQQVRAIDDAYNRAAEADFDEWRKDAREYDKLLAMLPDRAWLE